MAADLTGANRNAMAYMNNILKQYGLTSLGGDVLKMVQQGYQNDAISYQLTQTKAYQQRFAGNAIRVKNGLSELSPAEYLATERSYQQVLQSAGLPKGFYDSHSDFTNMIGKDVSPTEMKWRADTAAKYVQQTDPHTRDALQQYYGIDQNHLVAHFLDPNAAQSILQKQANAADIGSAALDQNLKATTRGRAETWADQGVTGAQAQTGYQKVAAVLPEDQQLQRRYGGDFSQTTAEDEFLGGLASAARKRSDLEDKEKAQFADNAVWDPRGVAGGKLGAY